MGFGNYARQLREQRQRINERYSIRQTAERVGMDPAYLSKVERGETSPPSEVVIRRLAADLGEDADLLLALAGRVASDIHNIIIQRPILFGELIRTLSDVTDDGLKRLVRNARNGRRSRWPSTAYPPLLVGEGLGVRASVGECTRPL